MNLTRLLPDGFECRQAGERIVVALPEYIDLLAGVEPSALRVAGHGRAPIRLLELPGGRGLLIRQYHRGGVLSSLNKDKYLSPRRAVDEIRVCREAAARGVPVADAVGAMLEHRPPVWLCRLVTARIDDAIDLGGYLGWLPATPTREVLAEKRDVIDALARAIRKMHDAGLYHADLQTRNILIRRSATGVEVFFVDLDKSVIVPSLTQRRRAGNLMRLNRSVMKMRPALPVDDDDRRRFLAAYRGGDPIFGHDLSPLLKSCSRHAAWHSIAWRLFR